MTIVGGPAVGADVTSCRCSHK